MARKVRRKRFSSAERRSFRAGLKAASRRRRRNYR